MTQQQYLSATRIKLADVSPGNILIADNGFPCIPAWRKCEVHMVDVDPSDLAIWCRGGANNRPFTCEHTLDSQVGEDGFLIGLRKVVP